MTDANPKDALLGKLGTQTLDMGLKVLLSTGWAQILVDTQHPQFRRSRPANAEDVELVQIVSTHSDLPDRGGIRRRER